MSEEDIEEGFEDGMSRCRRIVFSLENKLAQMKTERDEARRMYCNTMADAVSPYRSPEDIASGRGWDCFDKKNANV